MGALFFYVSFHFAQLATCDKQAEPLPAPACPPQPLSDYWFFQKVHRAQFPASLAGQWVYRPGQAITYSAGYLQCLDQERQGNCHDPDSWKKSNDSVRMSRHISILHSAVANSPGILNASDPWVWQSNRSQYAVLPYDERYRRTLARLLSNRTIYLIGDSLTRQWSQVMRCELIHELGISAKVANQLVVFISEHTGFPGPKIPRHKREKAKLKWEKTFSNTTTRDFIVFNFGHHVGKKLGVGWPYNYSEIMRDALAMEFGSIPDSHVFFRTTTVRHYLKGVGDWDTNYSKSGKVAPNMQATWSDYGGNHPEQPRQNLIAFDIMLCGVNNNSRRSTRRGMKLATNKNNSRIYQILDTSPMMLARADATFDGSHFCVPGPMTFWSRMFYRRIATIDKHSQ